MLRIRKATERGHADHGWLNTYHTFSFADYYDPKHMGFRALRVINEDRVQPKEGFPTHPHRDMEIITYVLEGALEHKDSMGNGSVIRPGEVQRMSAGTGITHSEFNHSGSELVHFLQIWIVPEKDGVAPSYEQTFFPDEEKRKKLRLIASRDGRNGSVTINQDVNLYAALLEQGEEIAHVVPAGRHVWLQVARGSVEINGHHLSPGDGAAVSDENQLIVIGKEKAEVLLFDLA
ncbi:MULTISPECIES: pirin family protein [Geobacter]|uniref:pirin family protein n=1 Tax=Geobacter TaxID=28231 RepID=UPI002573EF2C|nr:pirin family protein [Geobacter sulfurreducens]BEH09492.1 pirin family protein [Geobacter sulfurreducens subsp. ethanolicus]BET57375.1 pirin family protein [Geobacter sp. 60473]HML78599.1 pirin family protein [Geobacter sulfurreducens]